MPQPCPEPNQTACVLSKLALKPAQSPNLSNICKLFLLIPVVSYDHIVKLKEYNKITFGIIYYYLLKLMSTQ